MSAYFSAKCMAALCLLTCMVRMIRQYSYHSVIQPMFIVTNIADLTDYSPEQKNYHIFSHSLKAVWLAI